MPYLVIGFLFFFTAINFFSSIPYLQANTGDTLLGPDHVIMASTKSLVTIDQSKKNKCALDETKQALLDRINKARSQARQCGDKPYKAAKPLTWSCQLETAAKKHSNDMAKNNYFSHVSPEGARVGERVNATGYRWQSVGENIAAGQRSASVVIKGWLASPGHCANIMSNQFTEMGIAEINIPSSKYSYYWTQVFARPR